MKIYAKQVPPEWQESPLVMDYLDWDVFVYGNRHYNGHNAEHVDDLINRMYEAAEELKALMSGRGYYDSFIEIIDDLLPAPNCKKVYSRADRTRWKTLLLAFDAEAINDDDAFCAGMELINGKLYESGEIRGCCQGDWQNVIYPAEYGREWLEHFEIEYFNTGAEWRISEGELDSDDDYYFYSHEWNNDGIRAEIAEAAGTTPENVILLEFDCWHREPVYREVTA